MYNLLPRGRMNCQPTDLMVCTARRISTLNASSCQGWPSALKASCPRFWTALPPSRIPPRSRPWTVCAFHPAARLSPRPLSLSRGSSRSCLYWWRCLAGPWVGSWAGCLDRWRGESVERKARVSMGHLRISGPCDWWLLNLRGVTDFEVRVRRAGTQVYREVADGLVWSGRGGGVVRAECLEPAQEGKSNVSWARGGLGSGIKDLEERPYRMMAHVSELFSVCSRTAASTACLTGGWTSFGSRAQKIYGRMVPWSARWCEDESGAWAHIWLFRRAAVCCGIQLLVGLGFDVVDGLPDPAHCGGLLCWIRLVCWLAKLVSSVFCLRDTSSQFKHLGQHAGWFVVPQPTVFGLHITELVVYRLCSLEAAARRSKLLCLRFPHNTLGRVGDKGGKLCPKTKTAKSWHGEK